MATEEEHATAVIAALNAAIVAFNPAVAAQAFDYDDLPNPRPQNYVEVTVSRRFGGVQRDSGDWDGQLYRITTRVVGKFVKNARDLRSAAYAIEGAALTVAGQGTTPVEFETAEPIGPDDGWYSGLTSWTYALI